MSTNLKKILIGGGVILVLALGFMFFPSGGGSEGQVALLTSANAEENEFEAQIVSLLFELRSVDLSPEFLDSPMFLRLEDFSVTLEDQPSGRFNPFAPIGSDSSFPIPESSDEDTTDEGAANATTTSE